MDLIYKKLNIEIYDDGKWIIKKFLKSWNSDNAEYNKKQLHGINHKFCIEDYKLFQSKNPDFVEIVSFESNNDCDIVIMPKIKGKEWNQVKEDLPKDVIYNFCIVNSFKWIRAFLDFSLGNDRVFYHGDLRPANVFIDNNYNPCVIDPDSMEWISRENFLLNIQKQQADFFTEFYRFYK
tara:strand:+ start:5901 stop:6437 length:537 start_codon:yes stop_codon:yes gene_type:complete